MSKVFEYLSEVGEVIGKGLMAGAAGSLAMSISQMIEMKITNRSGSSTPAIVAGKALGVEPKGQSKLDAEKENGQIDGKTDQELQNKVQKNTTRFSQWMHYAYGSSQGIPRGILDLSGFQGWQAAVSHFAIVWGAEQIMLPKTGASKPITQWTPAMIASDLIHHTVYITVTSLVYDQMNNHS